MQIEIIIPTRDRPQELAACLRGLSEQPDGGEFHVWVVDDAGRVDARDVVRPFLDRLALDVVRLPTRRGAAAARNAAMRMISAGAIGFLDDDAIPAPDWMAVARARLAAWPEVAGLVGRILPVDEQRLLSVARQRIYDERDAFYQSATCQQRLRERFGGRHPEHCLAVDYLSGGNMWIRCEALESRIDFPEATLWGHDRQFADRLLSAGNLLAYVPELVIRHHHDARFLACFRKAMGHAYYSELGRTEVAEPLTLGRALRPAWNQLLGRPAEGIPAANVTQPLPGRAVLATLTAAYQLGRFMGRRKRRARK